ncbi:MAG: alpha/beta fold hydrolase [Pseudomonadota bacterium]
MLRLVPTYYWDRDTKQIAYFGAAYLGLDPDLMSEMQQKTYPARDGPEIQAYLTVPRGHAAHALPLVLMPHGGPFASEGWGFDFMAQLMASRGFAVLQPNFRGSILQGDVFHDAGKKQWGGKMQDDLTDGVQHLISEGIADPGRICIVGWSYGGYAALMGAIKTPGLYQCAASINGVSNLKRLAGRYSLDRDYRDFVREYVDLEGARLSDVSPTSQAEAVGVPVLLVQAADDHRVPVEHADEMARRLEKHGKTFQYERIEFGGGHSLTNGPARLTMMRAVEAYLLDHLGADQLAQLEPDEVLSR